MVWNGTGWEDVRSFHCAKMTPKGSVNQYEDLPDAIAIDGSLYQLQKSSANWVKYSGKASDLLNIEEDGFHGFKFTPPESCIRKSYLNYGDYLHTYNIVALYDALGKLSSGVDFKYCAGIRRWLSAVYFWNIQPIRYRDILSGHI